MQTTDAVFHPKMASLSRVLSLGFLTLLISDTHVQAPKETAYQLPQLLGKCNSNTPTGISPSRGGSRGDTKGPSIDLILVPPLPVRLAPALKKHKKKRKKEKHKKHRAPTPASAPAPTVLSPPMPHQPLAMVKSTPSHASTLSGGIGIQHHSESSRLWLRTGATGVILLAMNG